MKNLNTLIRTFTLLLIFGSFSLSPLAIADDKKSTESAEANTGDDKKKTDKDEKEPECD